jgi:flagellar protein FlaG
LVEFFIRQLKGLIAMTASVQSTNAGSGALASRLPPPSSTGSTVSTTSSTATPKVVAPRANSNIQFDAAQLSKNLQEAVKMLNEQMATTKRGLGFRVDEAINGPVVTVTSLSTGEVIRQIPNEVVVRVAHSIEKIKGLLLNAKA